MEGRQRECGGRWERISDFTEKEHVFQAKLLVVTAHFPVPNDSVLEQQSAEVEKRVLENETPLQLPQVAIRIHTGQSSCWFS